MFPSEETRLGSEDKEGRKMRECEKRRGRERGREREREGERGR